MKKEMVDESEINGPSTITRSYLRLQFSIPRLIKSSLDIHAGQETCRKTNLESTSPMKQPQNATAYFNLAHIADRPRAGKTRNANCTLLRDSSTLPWPQIDPVIDLDSSASKRLSPQDTVDWPLNSPASSATESTRKKRQSLRLRPSQYFENAEPPSPLRDTSLRSESRPKAPKMSLFNLFSRPKVERQRGYAERGLDVPQPQPAKDLRKTASTPNLFANVQQDNEALTQHSAPSPAATAPPRSKSRLKFAEATKPSFREGKTGPFEPPPLFQAYPQSMKDGCLGVSTMSVETAMHKSKGRKVEKTDENSSIDTRRSRATLRHGKDDLELPRKIFVLVTSGYLLQYAETGPSNRLPEKILHLSKDSAAFASDLVPGKHYVLQVSQAVDQQGAMVANSGSIFSKLGLRSAAARRMTSGFLLVLPSAKEMESWMTAIKREIVDLGGQDTDPDAAKPITRAPEAADALKKTPSHRYQVKRNPSKVDRLTSPTKEPDLSLPELEDDIDSDTDTATIDGIEIEASKLDDDSKEVAPRKRAVSDVPSISSSAAHSVDQTQLNNIRNSESNSARTSHTSQAGTFSSPVATSQPSSIAGSPPAEKPLAVADTGEQPSPQKSSGRSLASYSMNWRRSGVPLAMHKSGTLPPVLNVSPGKPKFAVIEESPITGKNPPLPINSSIKVPSPKKNLTAARSEPNLHVASQFNNKGNSEVPPPPPVPSAPPVAGAGPPPQPETAKAVDQPAESTQSQSNVPQRRMSLQPLATQHSVTRPPTSRPIDPNRGKRISFSMPLKINPSGIHSQPDSTGNNRRASQLHDPDTAGESPIVHTLTAKVDGSQPSAFSNWPSPPPSTALPNTPTPRSRYSLVPAPTTLPAIPVRPAPFPTGLQTHSAPAQPHSNTNTLRRPASLQVRSDFAPFLSSVRNAQTGQIDARAIPIRGMKPSRSASNVAQLATHSRGLRSTTPTVPEEADQAMPLPDRALSPNLPRPGSRTGSRRGLKTRSSLPELDFGLPVVGLGPPAPPPNAPLPPPPPGSRPTSPSQHGQVTNGIEAVAGLGIRVS
ncbi:uncharacterized protein LTR77_000702 [Saxophila tyrrhenica]|uniref:PH domain-containing protein n=1 Tax=Saxophila tyrrhenica TaxID=1690608 RepID=A0AAV9PQP7_9PEZI|nr:hypothetical protein LTR77_000702 [Saxophila tyrrhenica]